MPSNKGRGELPMEAWAVIDPKNRVIGGDNRLGIFWLQRTALAASEEHGEARILPVAITAIRYDLAALILRVVTGDGAQLENLAMTEDEWNEGAGISDNGKEIEVTIRRADWFAMIRAAGGSVIPL